MRAIVAGAGLAGLTAARDLKRAGWEVRVLEKADYAGGRSATVQQGGYLIDSGATQITSGYTEYLALMRELGLESAIKRCDDRIGILRDGRIHVLDGSRATSGLFSGVVGWKAKLSLLRAVRDLLRLKPPLNYLEISDNWRDDTENVAQYAKRRLNAEAYEYLLGPLLRGNFQRWADSVSKLDLFAVVRSFAGQKMYAVSGGIRTLPQALAAELDVTLNAEVTAVSSADGMAKVQWRTPNGGVTEATADVCVLAMRLPEAVAVCPEYAAIAGDVARDLQYTRGTLVHLGYDRPTETPIIGLFVPRRSHDDVCLLWLEHNKLPELCPPGHSLITCYFEDRPGGAAEEDDAALVDRAKAFVEATFPELAGHCDMAKTTRWPLAIPFATPGVYGQIAALRADIDPLSPIQPTGDYFTCVGQNAAIYQGRKTASHILAARPANKSRS